MSEKPNSLHWFPHDPARESSRTGNLGPLAHCAYVRLRDHAWLAHSRGEQPCTVPDSDDELARIVRMTPKEWRSASASVRRFFEKIGDRLIDPDLLNLWKRQQKAYRKRAFAGGKGGRAKAMRQQSGSNATTPPEQLEIEQEDTAPKGASVRLVSNAPPDAPAPEGARAGSVVDERPIEDRTVSRGDRRPFRLTDIVPVELRPASER